MFKGAYHYNFSKNIDTYATLGFGISLYKMHISPNINGESDLFYQESYTLDKSPNAPISQPVYHFRDLDHVNWEDGSSTHARLAMALYVGLRYYINKNWAINGEFGFTSASFKKDCNVYNLLSVGASYKF